MILADIIIEEIVNPVTNWCDCGHEKPEYYRRSGPHSPLEKTKLFKVKGRGFNKIYCEPCLVIARSLAKKIKR